MPEMLCGFFFFHPQKSNLGSMALLLPQNEKVYGAYYFYFVHSFTHLSADLSNFLMKGAC